MKVLAVIPARYGSTRLKAKPLMDMKGIPLVMRVWNSVKKAQGVDELIVATDHNAIVEVVSAGGGRAELTSPDCPSGGDRVAEIARRYPDYDIVLNVQGDDPMCHPDMINGLVDALREDEKAQVAVLVKTIEKDSEFTSPHIVKVVFDLYSNALYFSRSLIPFPRNPGGNVFKHIGPYAYRRDFLLDFSKWEQTPLEKSESLEMLRMLERGFRIKCVKTEHDTIEIDTEKDVQEYLEYLGRGEQ